MSVWGVDNRVMAYIVIYPLIIQEDFNLKLNIDDLMIEQRNELFKAMQSMFEEYRQREQAAKLSIHTPESLRRFNPICYDDDEDYDYKESTIPLNEINSQIPPSNAITTSPPVLLTRDPEDSLIMGNEDLSTIPKKESDEFIKSSVDDLIPIPSEFEDTSGSESVCILTSYDDVPEEKSMTFSNPLLNLNDNFISSDDESLSDEVVQDTVKIYSNPLFKFDDEYISSDVNPLFDDVLEDIECKDLMIPSLMRMSISLQAMMLSFYFTMIQVEPANIALMDFSSSLSFDNEVPSCPKACSKAYTQLHSQYDKLIDDFCKSQFDVISYQTGLESVEARLLKNTKCFNTAGEELSAVKHKLMLLHTAAKRRVNTANLPSEWKTHTLIWRNKADLEEQNLDDLFNSLKIYENHHAFDVQLSPTKPEQDLSHTSRPSAPIIEDWVSNSEEESEPKDPQQPVIDVLPYIPVTRPRHANKVVTKSKSPIRQQLTRNPSSKTSISPFKVNVVQVPVVSAAQGNSQLALQDKGVINSGCSRHMTKNMSYLSNFEELNGGYVAFGGNPKGGKITGK
nr:hypothetical protein [Tanacetum cinerariifolium]